LFRLDGDGQRKAWALSGPYLSGYSVPYVCLDPRDPRYAYAAATHKIWGAHLYVTADSGSSWNSLEATPRTEDFGSAEALRAIWCIAPGHASEPDTLYAGTDPAGLFVSTDRGRGWQSMDGLNRHPTRSQWEPARGGFAVHSIQVDPADRSRLYAAVSAGGAFRSDDAGLSWQAINRGVRAENLPQRYPLVGHNIHRLVMHPQASHRLYRQCYNGTYRSDDGGDSWTEITAGLPSDFGYALAVDPHHPDTLFTIPESSSHLRVTADAKLRVYRSVDAGAHWEPLTQGLPQEHVYVTVLREAMVTDPLAPCGVYFGTSSGHVFASPNGGTEWQALADFLPRVLCLAIAVIPDPVA
jgi:hypothetical protein